MLDEDCIPVVIMVLGGIKLHTILHNPLQCLAIRDSMSSSNLNDLRSCQQYATIPVFFFFFFFFFFSLIRKEDMKLWCEVLVTSIHHGAELNKAPPPSPARQPLFDQHPLAIRLICSIVECCDQTGGCRFFSLWQRTTCTVAERVPV
jgi:hypothetical protein